MGKEDGVTLEQWVNRHPKYWILCSACRYGRGEDLGRMVKAKYWDLRSWLSANMEFTAGFLHGIGS